MKGASAAVSTRRQPHSMITPAVCVSVCVGAGCYMHQVMCAIIITCFWDDISAYVIAIC